MGRENCTTGLLPVGKPYNRPGGRGNAPLLVAGATTFPPTGDYGCLAMGSCLYRKAWSRLFCPPDGGKSGAARIGGRAQRANPQNAYHVI